ncbi:MAG: sigma-70 family RNA polymerase sigma factor [Panacagrimonas sp.]
MADSEQLSALLRASAAGDEQAFSELYRLTSGHLNGVLMRLLKRRDLAEEALQDCYLKIWKKAETYDPGKGAPLTWLHSVARYRAFDLLRAKRPEVALPDEDSDRPLPPMSLADLSVDPQARTEEAQGLRRMQDCMQTLDDRQRQSLMMAYYEGYTHRELSERFAAPLGTVKAWVRRGLARLRQCLEAEAA